MRIVCAIPARVGSTRVSKKNLRYLGDKPLVAHVIETCKKANIFDEIYLNSEALIFKTIADNYDISFYHRDEKLAASNITTDLIMEDFLNHVECDYVIQVNPTSPFVTVEDLIGFKEKMLREGYATMQSVKLERIEGLFKGQYLNYDPMKIMPPSENLEPVILYSSGIMGFKRDVYQKNMKELGAATYGGGGSIGYYELVGFSTLDIDYEEDFQLAEVICRFLKLKTHYEPRYFSEITSEHGEDDPFLIMETDGVVNNDMFDANQGIVNVEDIIASKPPEQSWTKRVVNSDSNSATLICQLPGEGNRLHYHADWNEWWYIVKGRWEWEIEGRKTEVKKGDVVFIEKGKKHKITAIGDEAAIRLAVSREDVVHIYPHLNEVRSS